ncbi:MAG TPA: hypothetical protein DIU15_09840 [Deltaproteobacteria bacterium]|nr:hypothetical protein [Deltaproteobacteria bacterium]HCP46333.1 hypothetical protein [Deltaproteobacteria bacterium]
MVDGGVAEAVSQGTWNLSELYGGFDDPRLAADQQRARDGASAFVSRYRGRIGALDASEFLAALREFEAITALTGKPGHYASLRFSVSTDVPEVQAAYAQAQAFEAEINQELAFFTVELSSIPLQQFEALADSQELRPYRHYLHFQRMFTDYTLAEDVERTILRMQVTGRDAWVNLYTQVTSSLEFEVEVAGQLRVLTSSEVRALATDVDRSLRDRALQATVEAYEPHTPVLTHVFNTLFEEHRSEMTERGYDDVMDYTVLKDDLAPDIVDALLDVTTGHMPIVHRYHALRKRVLGLDDYGMQDVRAPAFGEEPQVSWERASELVVEAFTGFSPEAGDIATRFLTQGWVDVFPRKGKRGGAFCAPGYPPEHPWVMVNFTGKTDNVFTLAHELGHALHFTLALEQSPLNYWTGLPLAETASVFAELWLHEHLMSVSDDPKLQRQLLDRQIQGAVGTAFNQVAYIHWERRAHAARAESVASAGDFGRLWSEEQSRLLGDAVLLQDRDQHRWMRIPHFVFARFYCYSYAFGKLLTLGLADLWREQGAVFVSDYLALLRAGGSMTPSELVTELGIDLSDREFWERGCSVVDRYLIQLEELVD